MALDLTSPSETVRNAGEAEYQDRQADAQQPSASPSGLTPVAQAAFPDLGQSVGGLFAARQRQIQAATDKEAAQAPLIAEAQQNLEERAGAIPPPIQAPTIAPPPSRKLTEFLAPVQGESPEVSVQKMITGLGLFAQMGGALARGHAASGLAALTGALQGWQEGDTDRSARAFADWKAQTDQALKQWEIERTQRQDLINDTSRTFEDKMRLLTLEAYKNDNKAAIAALEAGSYKELIDVHVKQQEAALHLAQITGQLETARANQVLKERELEAKLQEIAEKGQERAERERDRQLKALTDLRKEFLDRGTKTGIETVRDQYQRVLTAQQHPSQAGDITLMYAFMKMLDPTSAIQQGDQANFQNAGNIDQRVWGLYNKLVTNNGSLDPSQRADFVNRATQLWNEKLGSHKELEAEYGRLAGVHGVSANDVVVDLVGRSRGGGWRRE